jgi:ribosome-interacting GTPase 1
VNKKHSLSDKSILNILDPNSDHHQLPPTIHSKEAQDGGLEVTLFDRMIKLYGNDITRMLTIQYRMHEAIMNFSSKVINLFYIHYKIEWYSYFLRFETSNTFKTC